MIRAREREEQRAGKVLVRDLRFDVDSLKQKIPKKLSMFARLNASLQLRVLFAPRQLQRLGSHRLAHLLRIPCQLLDKPPQPLSLTLSLFVELSGSGNPLSFSRSLEPAHELASTLTTPPHVDKVGLACSSTATPTSACPAPLRLQVKQ